MSFQRERSERFDFGRIVSRTLNTIQSQLNMFYAIALIGGGLPGALTQMLQIGNTNHADGTSRSAVAFGLMSLGSAIVTLTAKVLCDCILISGALAAFNGRKLVLSDHIRAGLAVILPVIGIYILSLLAIGLAASLLIVPGLIVMCMVCVAVPAEIAEHAGVVGALSRSVALTRGQRWSIFGALALYLVAASIVSIIIGLGVGLIFFGGVGRSYVNTQAGPLAYVGVVVATLLSAGVTMIGSVGVAALYAELRLVKEGPQTQSLAEVFA